MTDDHRLRTIELSDRPLFDSAFSLLAEPISDYTFAGTWTWRDALRLRMAVLHGHLCVFANSTGDLTLLMPPMATPQAVPGQLRLAVEESFDILDRYNRPRTGTDASRIEYVSTEMLERLQHAGLDLRETPIWGDYVYDTQSMIDLAGGALKSKRHARSKFLREHPGHEVRPLTPEDAPACVHLLELWADVGDAEHAGQRTTEEVETSLLRERDRLSTILALENLGALGLHGMTLWEADQLVGFTFGEALTPAQALIAAEKTHPDFDGAPQFIFSEFCRRNWAACPEVNAGDDWGIPSLRFTKLSYRPTRMLAKHVLTRQAAPLLADASEPMPVANPPHATSGQMREPPANLRLRPAHPQDLPLLVRLEHACFQHSGERFTDRQIRELIRNPRALVTIAELHNGSQPELAGWAVGLIRRHRHIRTGTLERLGRLYALAVDPSRRGLGLGRLLAEETLRSLSSQGVQRVFLEVRAANASAIALYRRLGFLPLRELPDYYGPGVDGLRMVLRIEPQEGPVLVAWGEAAD